MIKQCAIIFSNISEGRAFILQGVTVNDSKFLTFNKSHILCGTLKKEGPALRNIGNNNPSNLFACARLATVFLELRSRKTFAPNGRYCLYIIPYCLMNLACFRIILFLAQNPKLYPHPHPPPKHPLWTF